MSRSWQKKIQPQTTKQQSRNKIPVTLHSITPVDRTNGVEALIELLLASSVHQTKSKPPKPSQSLPAPNRSLSKTIKASPSLGNRPRPKKNHALSISNHPSQKHPQQRGPQTARQRTEERKPQGPSNRPHPSPTKTPSNLVKKAKETQQVLRSKTVFVYAC